MAIQIVITGGPNSGKTTIIKHLQSKYAEKGVIFLPEAASLLVENGFPLTNNGYEWSQFWQNELEDAIFAVQNAMENVAIDICSKKNYKYVVQDRGILDIAAYLDNGIVSLTERYKLPQATAHKRYEVVILLDSIANYGQDYLELHISHLKIHDYYNKNLEYDQKVRKAWEGHPNVHRAFSKSIDEKIRMVEEVLSKYI